MAQTTTLRAHGNADCSEARRRFAGVVARFKVFHFAGAAGGDPFREAGEFGEIADRRDSGEVEPGGEGGALDEVGNALLLQDLIISRTRKKH